MFFKILAEDREDSETVQLADRLQLSAVQRGHAKAQGSETLGFVIGIAKSEGAEVDPSRGVPIFLAKHVDGMWTTHYRLSEFYVMAPFEELHGTETEVVERFEEWLDAVQAHAVNSEAQNLALDTEVRITIEAFVSAWQLEGSTVELSAPDRRTAEALVRMAAELATDDHPPRTILAATFSWFAEKTGLFVDEFARAAGRTSGAAAGVGLAVGVAAASGQTPNVIQALSRVLHALG